MAKGDILYEFEVNDSRKITRYRLKDDGDGTIGVQIFNENRWINHSTFEQDVYSVSGLHGEIIVSLLAENSRLRNRFVDECKKWAKHHAGKPERVEYWEKLAEEISR